MIDAQLTTLVLLPVAAIGSIVNWAVFYSIVSLKSFKHSFGYLSANQAVADALHSTAFFVYFCPMCQTHEIALWFLTASTTITFYEVLCHLFYSDETGFFYFTDSPLCGNIGWYADFLKNAIIIVVIVMLDVTTVIRVRAVGQKFISGKWMIFFCTSFAWVAVHAVDGLIAVFCNPEIRKFLLSLGKIKQESTTITSVEPSRTNH